MANRNKVIAVVDDEAKMCVALTRLLKSHGYDVESFASGDDVLKAVQSTPPDCMLLDLHMPRTTGFDVLGSMLSMRLEVPIIVITGHDQPGNAERARGLGAKDYLLKTPRRVRLGGGNSARMPWWAPSVESKNSEPVLILTTFSHYFTDKKSCLTNHPKHSRPRPVIPSGCLAPARLAPYADKHGTKVVLRAANAAVKIGSVITRE